MKVIYKQPVADQLRDLIAKTQESDQLVDYIILTNQEYDRFMREVTAYGSHSNSGHFIFHGTTIRRQSKP
jgi:hypothetical protein